MSEWKDTTVANAIATSMTPRPTVEEWAQRIGYDVVGTTIGRPALAELLDVLKDAPFSCGHDEAGDPACDTGRIDIDVCCGLSGLRNAMGHVVALLGLMVAGTAEGHYRDQEGVEQARIKAMLRGLHKSAAHIDEGLAQLFADHC